MSARTKFILLCIILAAWASSALGADTTRKMKITLSIPNSKPQLSATNAAQSLKKGDNIQPITITAQQGNWITWTHNLPSDWTLSTAEDTQSCTITPASPPGLPSGNHSYTVTAQNDSGTASQNITINILGSNVNESLLTADGTFTGSPQTPLTTITPSGHSATTTETTFTDIYDRLMLSADIALTLASSDLIGIVNVPFSQTVSVDVTLQLEDKDYNSYGYSLNIKDLPDWLSASGELTSTDNKLAAGITTHHHEFRLSGKPTAPTDPADVVLTATVNVTGDTPDLRATGSKTVKVAALAPVLVSLDAALACNSLTLYYGNSGSISPTLTVKGKYSDGNVKILTAEEYSAQWSTTSPGIEGISLTDGKLNVAATAKIGTHKVPVFVIVSSGSVETSAQVNVEITVNDIAPSGISASASELEVTAGEALNVHVNLADGTNIVWSISGELPDGASVSSSDKTLTISGTTSLADAGQDFTLTVAAKNSAGEASTNIIIHVVDVVPALTSDTFSATAYKGEAFTLSITSTAGTNLVWDLAGAMPSGLSSSSVNGSFTISGTPQAGTSGTYSLTVTASNPKGYAQATVNIVVTGRSYPDYNEDIDTGMSEEPSESVDSAGRSVTSMQTVFRNGGGKLTSSIDIAFTVDSTDLAETAGITFAKTISVDVTVLLNDSDYNVYAYSLDVEYLPDWLEVSGEIVSIDENLAEGITVYHHEFELSGIPESEAEGVEVVFTATINISGDTPALSAVGIKNVNISVNDAELVSLDASLSSESLTLNYGETGNVAPVLSVKAKYSDGNIATLSVGDYFAQWSTSSPNIEGLTFADGTLNVGAGLSVGTYRFPVSARVSSADCEASVDGVIVVTVNDVMPAGISVNSSDVKASPGESVSVNVSLSSGSNIVWEISGELPSGLSVTSGDRLLCINGTASEADAGRMFTITVIASNTAGSESATIKFSVLDVVPLISSGSVSWDAAELAQFSQSLSATGTNILWSYSGNLPQGLVASSSDKTFTVSGTPASGSAGSYTLNVTAANSTGSATMKITLNVQAKPALSASSLNWTAAIGESFSQSLSATGTNIRWSYSGSLPQGLVASSSDRTFTVSGTPASGSAGSYTLNVTAANSAGSATTKITINVQEKPALSASSLNWTAVIGESFSQSLSATGTNLRWSYSGKLPQGLVATSNDKTFTVSGTPAQGTAGSYALNIMATNSAGTTEANVILTVSASSSDLPPQQESELNVEHITPTLTTFTDNSGSVIASIDVAINSSSTDFSPAFSQSFIVDTTISLDTDSFTLYSYSLDVQGLPDWLKLSGETLSTDNNIENAYHHVFTLSGKPSSPNAASVFLIAEVKVKISGDNCVLEALASKDITISATAASVVALNAEISCDSLNVNEGRYVQISPMLTVSAEFSDGSTSLLASNDYALTWSTPSSDIAGIAFADGVLTVDPSARAGSYGFPVIATVRHGNLEANASKNIIINVNREATPRNSSIDIAIITASNTFTLNAGQNFAQTVSIDVEVHAASSDYRAYALSADVSGLPDWLKIDGETAYSSDITAGNFHHSFRLIGTAPQSDSSFRAVIHVQAELSGSAGTLTTHASKDINISVKAASSVPASQNTSVTIDNDTTQNDTDIPTNSAPSSGSDSVPEARTPSSTENENNTLPEAQTPSTKSPPPATNSYLATGEINGLERETTLSEIAQSMTQEERDSVTTLKVDDNVHDISGLENFPQLERVDLTGATALKSIAISATSSVKQLYSPGNKSLRSVNISSSNLVYVDLSGSSSLEELDASGCTAMIRLECQDCSLQKIDITGNTSLEYIDCSRNSLNFLDAENCESLRSLYCYGQECVYSLSQREFSLEGLLSASGFDDDFAVSGIDRVSNLRAWDFDGREISADYDALNARAIFGVAPAKFVYDYFTGFMDVNMDVTVFSDSTYDDEQLNDEPEHSADSYASGDSGGCVVAMFPLCALCVVLLRRR